jgi:hypothetical protein
VDVTKVVAYIFALAIWASTYYALVLYPYSLDADIKLWLTAASGGAFTFVFGDQVASRTNRAASGNLDKGLQATPNDQMPTVTATTGPPAEVTVEATTTTSNGPSVTTEGRG